MSFNYRGSKLKEGIVVDKDRDLYLVIEDTNQFYVFKSVDELELLNPILWSGNGEIFTTMPLRRSNTQIQIENIRAEEWFEKTTNQ